MNEEYMFVGADHFDRDRYTGFQNRERALDAAIVQANIGESFEAYLEIFEAFYADNVEVSIENQEQPISGKARVRSLLAGFLVPLHMMAEIGGLLVSVRQSSLPSDCANETNSAWTVEFVGVCWREFCGRSSTTKCAVTRILIFAILNRRALA
jgi:hypothetical protein